MKFIVTTSGRDGQDWFPLEAQDFQQARAEANRIACLQQAKVIDLDLDDNQQAA